MSSLNCPTQSIQFNLILKAMSTVQSEICNPIQCIMYTDIVWCLPCMCWTEISQEKKAKKQCLLQNLRLTISCFLLWTCLSCCLATSRGTSQCNKEKNPTHWNAQLNWVFVALPCNALPQYSGANARKRIPTGTPFNHSSVARGANTTMICSSPLFICFSWGNHQHQKYKNAKIYKLKKY